MKEYLVAVYSNTCHVYFCRHLPADSPALHIEHAEKCDCVMVERAECKQRQRSQIADGVAAESNQVVQSMESVSRGRSHFNTGR